jgi:hypothetical protein
MDANGGGLMTKKNAGIQVSKPVKPSVITSIRHVVDYLQGEEEHFQECTPDEQKCHIWHDVQVLQKFLEDTRS